MNTLSKLQQEVIEKFDKNYPELSVIEGQGDEGSIHGYDAKPYIKELIRNTIEESYKSGKEEVLNNLHGFVCDMATSEQSKSLAKEDCLELIRYQIERIYGKKLQSLKEK